MVNSKENVTCSTYFSAEYIKWQTCLTSNKIKCVKREEKESERSGRGLSEFTITESRNRVTE